MYFRADAAFAEPKIYELLEAEGIRYKGRGTAEQHLPRMLGPAYFERKLARQLQIDLVLTWPDRDLDDAFV
jgi:hypothetical protein